MSGSGNAGASHRPRRRFGQNFLVDRSYIARIVSAISPARGDALLEIGPGQGALTAPLLECLDRLYAVEIDRDLARALQGRYPPERLVLFCEDALDFDYAQLPSPLRVVGNLPYNISTPLLFRLEAHAARFIDLHFMLQREVVDRMVAAPSTPAYGRLSVMLQRRFEMERLFVVPPGAFRPQPEVHSAVVCLRPRAAVIAGDVSDDSFRRVVSAAFSSRRKTLRNALAGLLDGSEIVAAGIDAGLRPENLDVTEFARLARIVERNADSAPIHKD